MKLFRTYYSSFKGLSKEVWLLAMVTFVNRAGTMVIPFLSLYLTEDRGFSLKDVGWVMTSFGLGSFAGSWLGGRLTDRFGYRPIMFWSLILTGFLFVGMQLIDTFWGMCIGVFFILLVADTFRPASFVAIAAYSKPENRVRSITLIRLAINLGFSFGPALGGFIIVSAGYSGLFWIDGLTCIVGAFLFIYLLKAKTYSKEKKVEENTKNLASPYKDSQFIIFLLSMLIIAFVFMQLFSTVPLYYSNVHLLSEDQIGWLLGANGVICFVVEMPLIKSLESGRHSKYRILIWSTVLMGLSYFVLNLTPWIGILWISMVLMTVGEMLNFPISNAWVMDRSEGKKSGAYMGLYTMCFALAHIFGHNIGMRLVDAVGYDITWLIMGVLMIGAVMLLRLLERGAGKNLVGESR